MYETLRGINRISFLLSIVKSEEMSSAYYIQVRPAVHLNLTQYHATRTSSMQSLVPPFIVHQQCATTSFGCAIPMCSSIAQPKKTRMCKCGHALCEKFEDIHANNGAGVAMLLKYYGQVPCIVLGYERAGCYKDTYNVIGGSMEHDDNHCWIANAYRECLQESKIDLKAKGIDLSDAVFVNTDHPAKFCGSCVFLCGGTPIFCVNMTSSGFSRGVLNATISAVNHTNADWCEREMYGVQFVSITGDQTCMTPTMVAGQIKLEHQKGITSKYEVLSGSQLVNEKTVCRGLSSYAIDVIMELRKLMRS